MAHDLSSRSYQTVMGHSQQPSLLLLSLLLLLGDIGTPCQAMVGVVWGGAPLRVQSKSSTKQRKGEREREGGGDRVEGGKH